MTIFAFLLYLQLNSFQAVVVGDASKDKIMVRYIYQDKAMNWNKAIYGSTEITYYPARIGTVFKVSSGNGVAQEYVASGIKPAVWILRPSVSLWPACPLPHILTSD